MSDSTASTPDSDITIARLAVELDTSSRTLLAHARDLNIAVYGPDDPLTDGDADLLRTTYTWLGEETVTEVTRPAPEDLLPGFTPRTIVRERDPDIEAIRRNLGVDQGRHGRRPGRPRTPYRDGRRFLAAPVPQPRRPRPVVPEQRAPAPKPPPLTGLAAKIVAAIPNTSDTIATSVARRWSDIGFSDAETLAWLNAGLEFGQAAVARELHGHGVRPHHLGIIIRKEPVLVRIQENRITARQVAEMLEREGHLRKAG